MCVMLCPMDVCKKINKILQPSQGRSCSSGLQYVSLRRSPKQQSNKRLQGQEQVLQPLGRASQRVPQSPVRWGTKRNHPKSGRKTCNFCLLCTGCKCEFLIHILEVGADRVEAGDYLSAFQYFWMSTSFQRSKPEIPRWDASEREEDPHEVHAWLADAEPTLKEFFGGTNHQRGFCCNVARSATAATIPDRISEYSRASSSDISEDSRGRSKDWDGSFAIGSIRVWLGMSQYCSRQAPFWT